MAVIFAQGFKQNGMCRKYILGCSIKFLLMEQRTTDTRFYQGYSPVLILINRLSDLKSLPENRFCIRWLLKEDKSVSKGKQGGGDVGMVFRKILSPQCQAILKIGGCFGVLFHILEQGAKVMQHYSVKRMVFGENSPANL